MYFKIANHPKIINGGIVPVVAPVDLVVEKLWVKINPGLAPAGVKTIDVMLRSQYIISSILNISIIEKYSEVERLYKEERISIQQANAVLSELRKFRFVSETINADNVESGIDFTESSINQFMDDFDNLNDTVKKAQTERDQAIAKLAKREEKFRKLEEKEDRKERRNESLYKIFKRSIVLITFIIFIIFIYYINTLRSIGCVNYILYSIGTIGSIFGILRAIGIEIKPIIKRKKPS